MVLKIFQKKKKFPRSDIQTVLYLNLFQRVIFVFFLFGVVLDRM